MELSKRIMEEIIGMDIPKFGTELGVERIIYIQGISDYRLSTFKRL